MTCDEFSWFDFHWIFFVVKSTNINLYICTFQATSMFRAFCTDPGISGLMCNWWLWEHGPHSWWSVKCDFCWCRTSPWNTGDFFSWPKKITAKFFFQKTWKNIIWPCPSIDTGWQNRASNLGFCGGSGCWGVPWLQFSKCHQNDATLGQLIRFNEMEEKIIYTLWSFCWNHKKPWVFWQTHANTWGANLFRGNWSWGKASKDHKKRSDLS